MDKILEKLFKVLLGDLSDLLSSFVAELSDIGLKIEDFISKVGFQKLNVEGIYNIVLSYGIILIILIFLKKGFETYILWTDGDPDANPLLLLTNFFKALAVAVCFPIMYEWMITIVREFLDRINNYFGEESFISYIKKFVAGSLGGTSGVFNSLMMLIGAILILVFLIKFIGTGLELLILRLGFPFACVGLLNSDGGVFKSYFSKLMQALFGIVVQIVIFMLALELFYSRKQMILGLATFMLAYRTPKILSEFMFTAGSGGGASRVITATSQTVNVIKNVGGMIKG